MRKTNFKLFYGAREIMPEILQKVYMAGICASWTRTSERIFRANQQKVISAGVMVDIWQKQRKQRRKRYSIKIKFKINCTYPRSETMKKLLTTIILLTIIATLHAQAPELKNMMPNSWQKLTRLSEEEEKEFLAKEEVISDIEQFKSDSWASPEYIIQEKRVYKEIVNNIEFFRVLVCNQNMNDFFDSKYCDRILFI